MRLSENGDGTVTVSAALLWMPIFTERGAFSLVGAKGRLHLDSDAVRVGRGSANAVLVAKRSGETYTLCLQEDRTRWLSFSSGAFSTEALPSKLCFLALVWQ